MTKQKGSHIITLISILVLLALAGGAIFVSNFSTRDAPVPVPAYPEYAAPKRNLTPAEKEVLDMPLHEASEERKQQYAQQVAQLAKSAPVLDITGCKPEPLVYRVNLQGDFQVRNNDPIPHTIRYLDLQIEIPAQSTTSVRTSQLFRKAGNYGYGCDNPFAKMGVFMVR